MWYGAPYAYGGEESKPPSFNPRPLELEGPEAPPGTPRKVNVRVTSVKPTGRIVAMVAPVENLPEHCSVRELQNLMYDYLCVPIRQPIELRFWGRPLHPDKLLKDYAIKEHSEITVVVKPKLPDGIPCGSSQLQRLRFSSHNLQGPIIIEGVSNDQTVFDLKGLLQMQLKANPIFLAIVSAPEDERTGTMPVRVGDHFELESCGVQAKSKGILKVRRVRDNASGIVNEADVAMLSLPVEQ
ncbi:MAG: hypothetical protein SGPRY_012234, partial [Prymnesium sp.]